MLGPQCGRFVRRTCRSARTVRSADPTSGFAIRAAATVASHAVAAGRRATTCRCPARAADAGSFASSSSSASSRRTASSCCSSRYLFCRTGMIVLPATSTTSNPARSNSFRSDARRERRQLEPLAVVGRQPVRPAGAHELLQRVEVPPLDEVVEGGQLVVGRRDHDAAGLGRAEHLAGGRGRVGADRQRVAHRQRRA